MQSSLRLVGLALGGLSSLGLALVTTGKAGAEPGRQSASPGRQRVTTAGTGLCFEANQGQFEERVRYLARGRGYGLFLTQEGATLALQRGGAGERAVLSMRVAGARATEPRGVDELSGRGNYAVGGDGRRWVNDVASFAGVEYPGVLPGVDLVFYGTGARELEYDLRLAPATDPGAIELELDGVAGIEISEAGAARLKLADGSVLEQPRPVAYQLDTSGARRLVLARFRVVSGKRLGFQLGAYDRARALVIDPVLSYATYLGGSKYDAFYAVAADSSGNTYAVGYTTGTLFPTQSAAQPGYGGGASDAVIVKLNAAGTNFVYATYLGGNDSDQAYGVAVDATGNAYVTGVTYSNNFPRLGALQSTFGGGLQDGFVAKLNPTGALVYSTYLGGSGDDLGQAIAVNAAGEAYVTGTTFSANFPKAAALQGALGGTNDAFVSKLSAAGGTLTYSTFLGGSGGEYGQGIALDNAGGALVVGQTGSSNFPTLSAVQATFGGSASDAFVSRLNPAGSAFVYSTYLGGTAPDVATGVAQVGGSAIVVGYTSSSNFPKLGASQAALAGDSDAFLTRLSQTGSSFDYSTYLGGSGSDVGNAVLVDSAGYVYVTGQTSSSDFPIVSALAGQEKSLSGSSDAFLAAFSAAAGTKAYATYLGGNAADAGVSVAAGANLLHVLGNTFSSNFPTQTPLFGAPLGPQDGFVARLPLLTLTPAPAGAWPSWLLLGTLLLGIGLVVLSSRQRFATAER
jgi:Beta-propeller repeat